MRLTENVILYMQYENSVQKLFELTRHIASVDGRTERQCDYYRVSAFQCGALKYLDDMFSVSRDNNSCNKLSTQFLSKQ